MITARAAFCLFSTPLSNKILILYHASSEPIWFPVSNFILPFFVRTATPMRSQSGSVAATRSAFSFSASSTAMVNASPYSGFDDYAAGSVQWRVNNPQRFRLANHSRIEDQRFEAAHIGLVDILSDNRHF